MIMSFQLLKIVFSYQQKAKLEMLENLGLQNIKVRFIPAIMAYDLYLLDRKMNISDLEL